MKINQLYILLLDIVKSDYHFQPGWVLIVILLSLIILGYLFTAYNNRFKLVIKSVITTGIFSQNVKEDISLFHPVSLLLSLTFLLTSSLFILQSLSSGVIFDFKIDFAFTSFLIIMAVIFLVYAVKILFLKIIAFVMDQQEMVSGYIAIIFQMNKFLGIALFPMVIFMAYGGDHFINAFIYFGMILFAAAFIARIGKGIGVVLSEQEVSLFYLILYLCTLEILPLLLGWKVLERFT